MSPGKSSLPRDILNQGERLALTWFWWGEAPELPYRLSKAHEAVPLYGRKGLKVAEPRANVSRENLDLGENMISARRT
jgi:hypothetical protein